VSGAFRAEHTARLLCYKSRMRLLVLFSFFAIALCVGQRQACAQSNGSQDSAVSGKLRPRWGSYLIETYPSPAKASDNITVQFYNHRDETLTCRIFDSDDRIVMELQPKQFTSHGLHSFPIAGYRLPSGSYFIRLTTFTESGAENVVDNSRFIILK
jgi:hypothetical protein